VSVTPAVRELKARQGSTYTDTFTVAVAGWPFPLEGAIVRMMVRPSITSDTVTLDLSSTNGKITVVPAAGRITVKVSATEMEQVAPRTYRYDMEIESANGDVTPLLEGTFVVAPQVTR
jgi:hypothetical protein